MVEKVKIVNDKPYLIILIGNSGVGKTNVYKGLNDEVFNSKENTTLGVSVLKSEFNYNINKNKKVKIDLWDTPGQVRFRNVSKTYFNKADGFFLIYDVTDRKSFTDIKMWIDTIKDSVDSTKQYKIFLLGNKIDLNDQRKVTKEEGLQTAETYNCEYREISAKTKANIVEITEEIAKLIHKTKPPELKFEIDSNKRRTQKNPNPKKCAC